MAQKTASKFSPGEWRTSTHPRWPAPSSPCVRAGGILVAIFPDCPSTTVKEREANARLVAVAPELLKQLKFMVRDWIEIVGNEEENSTPADRLEKAKAAIAKAEQA